MSINKWMKSDLVSIDDKIKIDKMNESEKKDAFNGLPSFGTAGMRGLMGPGSNRINILTINQISQALAIYMKTENKNKIVIACDTRNNSKEFLDSITNIFLLNDLKVYKFPVVVPVSILSFAVRYLNCDYGVYITSSHNPKEYNGYKLYNNNGCQIDKDTAEKICEIRKSVKLFAGYETSEREPIIIKRSLQNAFLDRIYDEKIFSEYSLKITYTGLYGTGNGIIDEFLMDCGFFVSKVPGQSYFDGNFPGLEAPNPEMKSVFADAIKVAKAYDSDIIIATDPDADRIGVMVKHNNEYIRITGNQLGVLLADYIVSNKNIKDSYIVKSDVSTDMIDEMFNGKNVKVITVPTGFKNIGKYMENSCDNFLFGFEESCGYLIGDYIRDKDAVGASILVAEMAAHYKLKNITLIDKLEELYKLYGYHVEKTLSIPTKNKINTLKLTGCFEDNNIMINSIKYNDNNLELFIEGAHIFARMSGTEPKLKIYIKTYSDTNEESVKFMKKYAKMLNDFVRCLN